MHQKKILPALIAAGFAAPALAQTISEPPLPPARLDPVVISAERTVQSSFDAPAAISAIGRDVIESGGPQVNLSEALNRVPGIVVLNRQNYAQDLQLSIRGFGARSTFGIRGVRLIVDGIPASMPDGQGQASNISLASTQRIEVLRGPLAQLYGNAAGGVVQTFTGTDAEVPTVGVSAYAGPYGQTKFGLNFGVNGPNDMVVLDVSRYRTDGWRPQSEAQREQLNAKWEHRAGDTTISLVANSLDQPLSKDPGGLTRGDFDANPRQTASASISQDASKVVLQQQLGAVLEQKLGAYTRFTGRLYAGTRSLDNKLSTLPQFQSSPTSAGGIVSFERSYAGAGAQLQHRVALGEGRSLRLTGGIEYDRMKEDRQGYLNTGGVQGDLKRDELNTVENRDLYAQVSVDIVPALTATAGVRRSRVEFRTEDRFIRTDTTPQNPDDSGGVDYSATNPVLGLTWHATRTLNVYANLGKGFETPTFSELAYRPNGLTGLNTELKAARSKHREVGAKWKVTDAHRLDAAYFDIDTENEIVVDTNQGGRTTFKNVAGRTERRGLELAWLGQYGSDWRTTLSLTTLRARFADRITIGSTPIPAGNRLPGTPERSAFAELAWAPAAAWGGFNAGLEVVHTGKLYVDDANSDAAAAATVVNLRAGFAQRVGDWRFTQLLRVDNAADKTYAGSVIVNAAQGRFFEPALPRTWMLGVTASYAFR